MGNKSLIFFKYLLAIVLLSLYACKDKAVDKEKNKREITTNELLYLISELRQFELDNNRDFYKTLSQDSDEYYENIINNFIKKEYSMSGSFSEINIKRNKTLEERHFIWETKLNNYFSSLAYTRFIKSKTNNHANNINKQREKELEEVINFINKNSLIIEKVDIGVFEASKEAIDLSIEKANKSINENLKKIVYTSAEVVSVFVTAGTSSIVVGAIETAEIGEVVHDVIIPEEDEVKQILTKEYILFLEQNDVNFTELLNKNTNIYYDYLLELIEKRLNEKILL